MTTSNVSTDDTPEPRNDIAVVTDETQAAQPAADEGQPDDQQQASQNIEDSASSEEKPKRNRRAERRIAKLNQELAQEREKTAQTQAELDARDQRIAELEAKLNDAPKPDKPKLADFEDEDAFVEAFQKWKDAQSPTSEPPNKPSPQPKRETPPAPPPGFKEDLDELNQAGRSKFGDEFDEVLKQDDLPMSLEMLDHIFESDLGAELVMHLDSHRRIAKRIYSSDDPAAALKELEKGLKPAADRSGKITVDDGNKPAQKPKKDEPPTHEKTGAGAPAQDLSDMSMEDYAAARRKQQSNRY